MNVARIQDFEREGRIVCKYSGCTLITPHAQRERGKVIDRGVHIRECASTLYLGLTNPLP